MGPLHPLALALPDPPKVGLRERRDLLEVWVISTMVGMVQLLQYILAFPEVGGQLLGDPPGIVCLGGEATLELGGSGDASGPRLHPNVSRYP